MILVGIFVFPVLGQDTGTIEFLGPTDEVVWGNVKLAFHPRGTQKSS